MPEDYGFGYKRMFADGGSEASYIPSESIKDYIKRQEAFRSKWYKDGNGIDTVGYGFTGKNVAKQYPNGMTRKEADAYFDNLVWRFARRMERLTPNIDRLTQNQKDALFSYFYNIGEGNYTKGSPKMQQALRDFDLEAVMQNIDAGYDDKKNPGLRKRRDYERELFGGDINPVQGEGVVVGESPALYAPEIQRFNTQIPLVNENAETVRPFLYDSGYIRPLPRVSIAEGDVYSRPVEETVTKKPITGSLLADEIKSSLMGDTSQPMLFNAFIPTSVQSTLKNYRSGGGIHIAPSKKGTFTAAAKKHGKSVQAFASQVLAHKDNYSPAMVKKANFARNAARWHEDGGIIDRLNRIYGEGALDVVRNLRKDNKFDRGGDVELNEGDARKRAEIMARYSGGIKGPFDWLTHKTSLLKGYNVWKERGDQSDIVLENGIDPKAFFDKNPKLTNYSGIGRLSFNKDSNDKRSVLLSPEFSRRFKNDFISALYNGEIPLEEAGVVPIVESRDIYGRILPEERHPDVSGDNFRGYRLPGEEPNVAPFLDEQVRQGNFIQKRRGYNSEYEPDWRIGNYRYFYDAGGHQYVEVEYDGKKYYKLVDKFDTVRTHTAPGLRDANNFISAYEIPYIVTTPWREVK